MSLTVTSISLSGAFPGPNHKSGIAPHYASVCSTFRVRNRKELNASLKGTTLGDADGDTDDTLKWLKRAKKREKELAKKRQEELDNMDKAVQEEYSEKYANILFYLPYCMFICIL